MSKIPSLTTMRRTAAEILAAAVLEQFPGTFLLGGSGSSLGFHYDFIFPFPFQKEFLPLLEEKMRAIMKEARFIEMKEMMPKNAASFFEHHKQPYLADLAESLDGPLVSIFHMDRFQGICVPPYLNNTSEIGAFKLTETKLVSKEIVRVTGNVFFEKEDLKEYSKRLKKYPLTSHQVLGQEMQLFSEYKKGFWVWHSKGELLRALLLDLWHQELEKENFNFISTAGSLTEEERIGLHQRFAPKTAHIVDTTLPKAELEGMLKTHAFTEARGYIACGEGGLLQACISSLQLATKISKMLGFESQVVLSSGSGRFSVSWQKTIEMFERALKQEGLEYACDAEEILTHGPRIEWRIKDALGRQWCGPYLEMRVEKRCLVHSAYGALERFAALLLEQKEGSLPFWLAPEQVRVFVVSKNVFESAEGYVAQLKKLGFRATLDKQDVESLGTRVHKSLREKVPYCIFIGDNELKTGELTVRAYGSAEEKMRIEDLIQTLSLRLQKHGRSI